MLERKVKLNQEDAEKLPNNSVIILGDTTTKTDIMEWMINTQLGRRNLIPAQKLTVLDKFKQRVAEEAKERQSEAGKEYGKGKINSMSPIGAKLSKPRTDAQVAKMAGVGTGTVARYNKVMNSDIKYSDIRSFYSSLMKDREFKPNTLESVNSILHPVFTLAMRDGYIRVNPTDGVMSEIKKSHGWEKSKRHALTIEEQQAFVDYVSNTKRYNRWLTLFTVFLGTGCRVGEIVGLRWEDCDFENNIISINHNLIYRQQNSGKCEFHITTPKTSAGIRSIPMLKDVKKALLQEKKKQFTQGLNQVEIDGYSGFVFMNRAGHVHNPLTINRAIKNIINAYNKEENLKAQKEKRKPLEIRDFSVHNFRHTFCTRFCENETNLKIIQEIMGHSDIGITMNIYAEATNSKKQEAFSQLEGKIKIC